jgi:RNA polymerase sigma-B factor
VLRRLRSRRDDVVATLTLPRRNPGRHWSMLGVDAPADVDPETWRLHVAYARSREPALRAQLAAVYDPHARALARRFFRGREPLDDLVQVAREGLLLALDRFDPGRRLPFPSFANPTITGSLKRYYRDSGWGLRVPRRVHDLAKPTRLAADALGQELGRPPTVPELAAALSVSEDDVLEALAASDARFTSSLDAPAGDGGTTLAASLGAQDGRLAEVENRAALEAALTTLGERDRELLELYFGQEWTQSEIAARLGVSQMQISRLLASAVRRLRSHM